MTNSIADTICVGCNCNRVRCLLRDESFAIYRCANCHLSFVSPPPTNLVKIYQQDFYHGDEFLRETLKWHVENRLRKLLPHGRILDVGCGIGEFLTICNDQGYETHGIDISEWAVDVCKKAGLQAEVGTLPNAEYPRDYFHCVTMWDVVEHLTDPRAHLQSAWEILRPDGWLIVKTPNVSKVLFLLAAITKRLRSSSKNMEAILGLPAHILYFNLRSLTELVRSNGFIPRRVVSMGRMRAKPQARTVNGWIYQSLWSGLSQFGLAGNLLIYAQKPGKIEVATE